MVVASTSTDSTEPRPKGYTPPKGRPTARKGERAARRGLSSTVEWMIVIFLLLAIFAAIFYFGRDIGGPGGGGHNGAEVPLAVTRAALGV
jgi:uncharacterized RDD family membrane protein YckC